MSPAHEKTRRRRRSERGIALLTVLVTVAMLTTVVVQFIYQTRVDVQMAANARDRLKAYYLARSAANFARLILFFQGQIDRMTGGSIKLYELVPIESDMARALTSGEFAEAFGLSGADLGEKRGFGEFDGSFSASIEDEYKKINLNALDSLPSIVGPTVAQILALITNPRYRAMFEGEDAEGQYTSPADIVTAIHDWIDADTTVDSFSPDPLIQSPFTHTEIFLPGASSEDASYDMLRGDPYKTKNNPFVTVDELHLARGVGDDFMDEFGSRFTVYSDPSLLLNLSSVNDPVTMLSVLCMQPENAAMCTEQGLPQLLEVLTQFFEFRSILQMTTLMVPNNQAIQAFFQGLGPVLSQELMRNLAPFSDTFSVEAQGTVGDVTVTIKTVLKNTVSGQEIMYWRVM